jgi:hydrogenase maturation factor
MCVANARVLTEVWDEGGLPMGRVRSATAGVDENAGDVVCLMYVPEAAPGQAVLVHLGFVMEIVDPAV